MYTTSHATMLVLLAAIFIFTQEVSALPGNLAPDAEITASSEFSAQYQAKFAADGVVPLPMGQADAGKAWCVNGAEDNTSAEICFYWPEPVTVRELICYARTGWFMNECWKDFTVYCLEQAEPLKTGTLEMEHGPQRIRLPEPVRTRKLILKFTSSHGGGNPGASEIQIFSRPPSEAVLMGWFRKNGMIFIPHCDEVQPGALEKLCGELAGLYGDAFTRYAERLQAAGAEPAALQRDMLLFDVNQLIVIRRHEIVASHVYTYHYEGFQPGGGLYRVDLAGGKPVFHELAASPEGQILDCDLSYDGRTILFSWRRSEDEGYHLWAVNTDGANLRQITRGPWHDYNGCWLPDGGIAFLSSRKAQFAYCWHAPVGVLHRMDADGGNVVCLSANYLNDFTPYVLHDGRIIYSRWEYVDKPAIPIQSLWTVNPDGAALSGYFGNRVLSPGTFMEARQIPGTTRIICTMTGHNGPTRGAIGIIDRLKGLNAQAAIDNITPDVPVPPVDAGNGNTEGTKRYSCPVPLDEKRFLLSAKGPVLVRTYDNTCVSTVLEAPADRMQYFSAQPVRSRPRPPVIASSFRPETEMAAVYLQDVYQGLSPHVERGEVKRIRVVREMEKAVRIDPDRRAFGFQFPVISCGATYAGKDVIGEAAVDEDGSAYFHVPAGMPVYFMALDAEGRAVQRMRSFTHFMPGESQGCIGCHESRLHTSGGALGSAIRRAPQCLQPPEWGSGGFDYVRIVQPVLDRYCIRCHDALDPPRGLDLTGDRTDFFNVSYDVLARENQGPAGSPYIRWIPTYNGHEQNILKIAPKTWGARTSRLAEITASGHPDAQGAPRFDMDPESRRRLYAWMDLNVPYYASSETAWPERRGCRQFYPEKLDAALEDTAARRCAGCHDQGVPRRAWVRITNPELNPFLTAPLAVEAGGSGKCGTPVFSDKSDPDYQHILGTFTAIETLLAERPRMDMPGGIPASDVCRDRK
jgi:hypothetical protein